MLIVALALDYCENIGFIKKQITKLSKRILYTYYVMLCQRHNADQKGTNIALNVIFKYFSVK